MERKTIVEERVVSFNPEDSRYCGLELSRYGKQLTISGSCGTVTTRKNLDNQVKEYWEDKDLEDEWGYMADEQGITDKDERKRMLQSLANQLQQEDYPFEVHEEIYIPEIHDDVVFDVDSGGQVDSEVCRRGVNAVGSAIHLESICKIWNKYHLKDTPNTIHKQAKDLLNSFPSYDKFAKAWASKSVRVQKMTDSKIRTLDEFRRKR